MMLPIELDYPWYLGTGVVALFAALGTWVLLTARDDGVRLCRALALLIAGPAVGLNLMTWNARIDSRGVTVRAPFAILDASGFIAWQDVAYAEIDERLVDRGISITLGNRSGRRLNIPLARLPAAMIPELARTVVARSTNARFNCGCDCETASGFTAMADRVARDRSRLSALRVRPAAQVAAQAAAQAAAGAAPVSMAFFAPAKH